MFSCRTSASFPQLEITHGARGTFSFQKLSQQLLLHRPLTRPLSLHSLCPVGPQPRISPSSLSPPHLNSDFNPIFFSDNSFGSQRVDSPHLWWWWWKRRRRRRRKRRRRRGGGGGKGSDLYLYDYQECVKCHTQTFTHVRTRARTHTNTPPLALIYTHFTIPARRRFSARNAWQKFSKVSVLVCLLHKGSLESTFENFCINL
jgi:hypothetical protein